MTDKTKPHLHGLAKQERSPSRERSVGGPEQLQFELRLPQLIDIPTLASRLGTSTRHIRHLINDKKVPYLKVGHLVRFDVYEIAEWLKGNRFGPGDPPAVASGQ